jgi:uncharacterized protein (DUF1330 family)
MKMNYKFVLAVLVGIAIGIAGVTTMHARQMKAAPGYVIAEVDVHDATSFQKYSSQVAGTLTPYNGHFLARGGKVVAVEGEAPKRFVIIAFDSVEKAQAWEDSPGYSAIKPIRHSSATSRVWIAEGLAGN